MRYITDKGIRGEFYLAIESLMSTWIDMLSIAFDSNSSAEEYGWLGTPPGLSEVKGEKRGEELAEYYYQLRNRTYQAGMNFKREDLERDKTGQMALARTRDFGTRCANHWVKLMSTLLLAGTGTTYGTCYDGNNFFSASHSEKKSGTQKNLLTKTTVSSLQVATAATPTSTEAVKAVLGVVTHMLAILDDQGEPLNADAKNFMVMCSPALWQWLVPALVNTTINQGDTNTIQSLKQDGFNVRIVANPFFTSTTAFMMFRTDAPLKPLIRQEEIPLEIDVFDQESEHYKLNDQMLVKAYARRAVGWGRWQYAAHATLST
jgi:phage major head subunit gpT-like protein